MHLGWSSEEAALEHEESPLESSSIAGGISVSPNLFGGFTVKMTMSPQELVAVRNNLMSAFRGGSSLVGADGFTVNVRNVKFTGNPDGSATVETSVSLSEFSDLKKVMSFINQSGGASAPIAAAPSLFHSERAAPPTSPPQAAAKAEPKSAFSTSNRSNILNPFRSPASAKADVKPATTPTTPPASSSPPSLFHQALEAVVPSRFLTPSSSTPSPTKAPASAQSPSTFRNILSAVVPSRFLSPTSGVMGHARHHAAFTKLALRGGSA